MLDTVMKNKDTQEMEEVVFLYRMGEKGQERGHKNSMKRGYSSVS
jgi:hypothetical protein